MVFFIIPSVKRQVVSLMHTELWYVQRGYISEPNPLLDASGSFWSISWYRQDTLAYYVVCYIVNNINYDKENKKMFLILFMTHVFQFWKFWNWEGVMVRISGKKIIHIPLILYTVIADWFEEKKCQACRLQGCVHGSWTWSDLLNHQHGDIVAVGVIMLCSPLLTSSVGGQLQE